MKSQLKAGDVSLTKKLENDRVVLYSLTSTWTIEIELSSDGNTVFLTFLRNGVSGRNPMILTAILEEVERLLQIAIANHEAAVARGEGIHSAGYGVYGELFKLLQKGGH